MAGEESMRERVGGEDSGNTAVSCGVFWALVMTWTLILSKVGGFEEESVTVLLGGRVEGDRHGLSMPAAQP